MVTSTGLAASQFSNKQVSTGPADSKTRSLDFSNETVRTKKRQKVKKAQSHKVEVALHVDTI